MLKYFFSGIPAYNLFIGIGIALAMFHLQYDRYFLVLDTHQKSSIHEVIVFSLISGFLGAYLFDAYTQGIPISYDNMSKIGLTFLGGAVSGILVLMLFLRINSIPVCKTLNMLTIPMCIAHTWGRIGCFFAGCCYGKPTDCILGVQFPQDSLAYHQFGENIKVHPTQLYESSYIILIIFLIMKFSIRHRFVFYTIFYSVFRFLIEFIRADNRGNLFNQNFLSPSQVISVVVFLAVITICTCRTTNKKNNKSALGNSSTNSAFGS